MKSVEEKKDKTDERWGSIVCTMVTAFLFLCLFDPNLGGEGALHCGSVPTFIPRCS
jgi:hypothetical protein